MRGNCAVQSPSSPIPPQRREWYQKGQDRLSKIDRWVSSWHKAWNMQVFFRQSQRIYKGTFLTLRKLQWARWLIFNLHCTHPSAMLYSYCNLNQITPFGKTKEKQNKTRKWMKGFCSHWICSLAMWYKFMCGCWNEEKQIKIKMITAWLRGKI